MTFSPPAANRQTSSQREQQYWETHLADELLLAGQEAWLSYSRRKYARWVRKYLRGGVRVLKTDSFEEIRGCEIRDAMLERFQQVVVEDLALPALSQSAERQGMRGLSWVQTPVQRQPFRDGSFDAVVSFSTLDHFRTTQEIGESLVELARITRRGGELLITLDNGGNPIVAGRNVLPNRLLRAIGLAPYEYGKTLGPEQFRRVLGESGWTVRDFRTVVHEPRVLAVAFAKYCKADGFLTPERYGRILSKFRLLERLPTCQRTGHFLLAVAERSS